MAKHHQYDRFTRERFEEELPEGFRRTKVAKTHELVYEKELEQGFAIRVYSSVQADKEVSRKCGSDAIRVLLRHGPSGTAVKHSSKTYRIKDGNGERKWPENLRGKIEELAENCGDYIYYCPFCGGLMKEVSRGFYGCSNFPECRYTTESDSDGKPIPEIVSERAKEAYRFLMDKHDHQNCDLCSGGTETPADFYDSLFHYVLGNGRLTDEQYGCIKDEIEAGSD